MASPKSAIVGTPPYIAPERANFQSGDQRSDIYSLGATLYKLLTGSHPFAGAQYDTLLKKLVALSTKPVPSIQDRRSDVPAELADVVHRMLAKDPAERYQSCSELIDLIANVLRDVPVPPAQSRPGGRQRMR